MTTETKSTNKTSDNKAVFGPLGKYAVVAVIMASIIITTAVMLNRQLGSVEEQIASIENEVAELYTVNSATTEIQSAAPAVSEVKEDITIVAVEEAVAEAETVESTSVADTVTDNTIKSATTKTQSAALAVSEVKEDITVIAVEENVAKVETAVAPIAAPVNSEASNHAIQPWSNHSETSATAHQAQIAKREQERQARREASKLEQKQHMGEIFARIKALETKQLDQYKESQEKQITHLREQNARQQTMIDALILRNKDNFELRASNFQRNQENREQILNRI